MSRNSKKNHPTDTAPYHEKGVKCLWHNYLQEITWNIIQECKENCSTFPTTESVSHAGRVNILGENCMKCPEIFQFPERDLCQQYPLLTPQWGGGGVSQSEIQFLCISAHFMQFPDFFNLPTPDTDPMWHQNDLEAFTVIWSATALLYC